jgi:hypothetical protein
MKEQRKYLTEDELKRFLKGIESTRDRAQVRDDALREIEEEPERILTEYKRRFGNVLGKTMLVEEMNLPNSPNPAAPNCGVVAAEELSNPIASAWKILGGSPMWCTPALTQVPERRWSDVVRPILGRRSGGPVGLRWKRMLYV